MWPEETPAQALKRTGDTEEWFRAFIHFYGCWPYGAWKNIWAGYTSTQKEACVTKYLLEGAGMWVLTDATCKKILGDRG